MARDIPGLLETLFPQLVPGIVAHFNRGAFSIAGCDPVPAEVLEESHLQRSMLFELAVAVAERRLFDVNSIDWSECLGVAVRRQRRHFDVSIPDTLYPADKRVAEWVAANLVTCLSELSLTYSEQVLKSPYIPGFHWIAPGLGDFSIGNKLVEVKCTNKRFSSADYRQVLIYWLLGYASSLEHNTAEWSDVLLVNPRSNQVVCLPFDEIIYVTSAGRSKVELLELFASLVSEPSFA